MTAPTHVVLSAPDEDEATVTHAVEQLLVTEFDVDTVVLALAADALRSTVYDAPDGFGSQPDTYHYDVAFLMSGVTGEEALPAFGIREGVDTAWAGATAVYFRRLSAHRTKSKMSTVMSSPLYMRMTIRNWRTSTTLAAMLDGGPANL